MHLRMLHCKLLVSHKHIKKYKHETSYLLNAITLIEVTQVVTNDMFCMFLGQYIY